MSKKGGVLSLEEALETGVSMAKKTGKTVTGAVADTTKAAASQIAGSDNAVSDKDIVKSLYGMKDDKKTTSTVNVQNQTSQTGTVDKNTVQDLEEEKKLKELRAQLYREVYYDPLVNPKKPKEEERPAEKVEKEKKQEMAELPEREKEKPPPLAIQRTQQRVEKFPGRSG